MVPTGLGRDIDKFLNDPRILSLKDSIAVSDAHIQELMGGMERFIEIVQRSLGLGDGLPVSDSELSRARLWEKSLKEWMGERRMQAAEERRLLESQSRMMSMDRVAVLIAVLADSVKRNVADPAEVAAVGRDLAAVLGRLTGTTIGPEAGPPIEGEFRQLENGQED